MNEDIGIGFSDESLRRIAEEKIKYRMTVRIHFYIFLFVNLLLVSINLLTSWGYFWFIFPFLGWFIGFATHATAYTLYARGVYPMAKRTVILHFIVYFTVNLLLFVIDVDLYNHFHLNPPTWFYYPLAGWGAGFLIHAVIYRVFFSGKITKDGVAKSRKEKAIEKEMERMRRKIKRNL